MTITSPAWAPNSAVRVSGNDTIQSGGGRILGFDESPEVVEGNVENLRTVILEFPSREAFRAWYDSDTYQAILPLRLESTPGSLIVVNGVPAPS